MSNKVTLIPIAMITPTAEFIYAPSQNRQTIEVNEGEYTQVQDMSVSFDKDGKSNPVQTPSYIKTDKPMLGRFIKK